MIYRFAQLSDLDQLVQLRVLMQLEVSELTEDHVSTQYSEQVKNYFLQAIPNRTYVSAVALDNEKMVATAGACFYEKPPSIMGGTGLVGYITNVYTMRSYRKQGIATRLMKNLTELAVELNADKLHLGATHDGAGIYKAIGYKEPSFISLELQSPYFLKSNK